MIGACICVARGDLPPNAIYLAMHAPYQLLFPLAPPTGLVLHSAQFVFNRGQTLYILPPSFSYPFLTPRDEGNALMSLEEAQTSERFFESVVVPTVKRQWQEEKQNSARTGELSIVDSWKYYMHRTCPDEAMKQTWEEYTLTLREQKEEEFKVRNNDSPLFPFLYPSLS